MSFTETAQRGRAPKPGKPPSTAGWLEVAEIVDKILKRGARRLSTLRNHVQIALGLTNEQWEELAEIRPDIIRKIELSWVERHGKIEQGVYKKAEKDADFGFKILQAIDPENWKSAEKREVSGPDGTPIKHKIDLSDLTTEELAALRPIVAKLENLHGSGASTNRDPDNQGH